MNYSLKNLKIDLYGSLSPFLSLNGNVQTRHISFSFSNSPFIIASRSLSVFSSTFKHLGNQIILSYEETKTKYVILKCNTFSDCSLTNIGFVFNVENVDIEISKCTFSNIITTSTSTCFYAVTCNVNITHCSFNKCRCSHGNAKYGNTFCTSHSNNTIEYISTTFCADDPDSGDSSIALIYSNEIKYQYSNSTENICDQGAACITLLNSPSEINYLKYLNIKDCVDYFIFETYGTKTTYIEYCNIINSEKCTSRVINNPTTTSYLYLTNCCFINPKSILLSNYQRVTFVDNKSDLSSLSQYFTIQKSVEQNIFDFSINLNCNNNKCVLISQKTCLDYDIHLLYCLILIK